MGCSHNQEGQQASVCGSSKEKEGEGKKRKGGKEKRKGGKERRKKRRKEKKRGEKERKKKEEKEGVCDAPKPGGPLMTRQPTEYS